MAVTTQGSGYDSPLHANLRQEVDLEQVSARLLAAAAESMQPEPA